MSAAGTEAAKSAESGPQAGLRDRYDQWSSTYDEDTARYGWCAPDRLLGAVREVLAFEPHLRVVDLGVGTGQAAGPLLDVGARVIGLDLAPAMLERADRLRPGFFRLVEHDLDRPLHEAGLRPADTDLVLGCGVLHFVRDLAGLIAQSAALLEAGGILAFTYIPPQTRSFSGATRVREPAEVERWIASAGLELVRHEDFIAYRQGGDDGEAVHYRLLVARDRRPRPELPGALAHIDRTACVDRPRLHELVRTPLVSAQRGNEAASARVSFAPGDACDVLAIFAHPDDESIYAGGTLAALAEAGHRVHLVTLTDGAGGRGGVGGELAARRAEELTAAASILGLAGHEILDFDDFGKHEDAARTRPHTGDDAAERWGRERVVEALVAAIESHEPRLVLGFESTRDPNYSLHGHHLAAGSLTSEAVRTARWSVAAQWAVVAPEDVGPEGLYVETPSSTKARAVAAHRTQAFSSRRLLAQLAAAPVVREGWHLVQGRAFEGESSIERLAGAPRAVRPVRVAVDSPARLLREGKPDRERFFPSTLIDASAGPVLTGQQAGIFGGPALTLHKALGAVLEARRIGGKARFWMATQDHDLAEIARLRFSKGGGRPLRWSARDERKPVGGLRFGDEIVELRRAALAYLDDAPHREETRALLERHYVPGRTVGEAFAGLLGELVPELEVLDPCDSAVAEASAPVLDAVLRDPAGVLQVQRDRALALREAGLRPPVERDPSALPLFFTDASGRRCPVLLEEGGLRLGNGEATTADELRAVLAREPGRLTPDVLLRPACQDGATGAAIYVGGPTELGYWAQATALHAHLGIRPAALRLRPHVAMIDPTDASLLTQSSGLDLAALLDVGEAGMDPWVLRPENMERAEVHRTLSTLREGLLDPNTPGPEDLEAVATTLAPILEQLRVVEGRLGSTARAVDNQCVLRLRRASRLRLKGAPARREVGAAIRTLTRLERALLKAHRRTRRPIIQAAWRLDTQDRSQPLIELVARFGPGLAQGLLEALDDRGPAARGGAYPEWQQRIIVMGDDT